METPRWTLRRLDSPTETELEGLAALLTDCVAGGASVSFMHPLSHGRALAFWRDVAEGVKQGERSLVVAEDEGGVCGTVQLILRQPENQPHRADLSKMLVHSRARRRGLGAALMRAAEDAARDAGKSLLVLDTASPEAERLYVRMGWTRVGTVPGFALHPHGGRIGTTFYYREIAQEMTRDVT